MSHPVAPGAAHQFVGGYEIDPSQPDRCQVCGRPHADHAAVAPGAGSLEALIQKWRIRAEVLINDREVMRDDRVRARAMRECADELEAVLSSSGRPQQFQQRTRKWLLACFGEAISDDVTERNHRFLEESLELVQSTGCTSSEAHQLVDYVFARPVGERDQELGGTMVTLAALCSAIDADMELAAERELTRVWAAMEKIRAKQAAKPKHSPLPVADQPTQAKE